MSTTEKPWLKVYEGRTLPNCSQYVAGFFATVRLGAIGTQLNPIFVVKKQDNNESVEFRDELPKSTAGKLLRRVLAGQERKKADTWTAEPPSPS